MEYTQTQNNIKRRKAFTPFFSLCQLLFGGDGLYQSAVILVRSNISLMHSLFYKPLWVNGFLIFLELPDTLVDPIVCLILSIYPGTNLAKPVDHTDDARTDQQIDPIILQNVIQQPQSSNKQTKNEKDKIAIAAAFPIVIMIIVIVHLNLYFLRTKFSGILSIKHQLSSLDIDCNSYLSTGQGRFSHRQH